MAGQTFHDRLTAAKLILSGQNLARVVCKATTEEVIGPKKKHLDYLIQCTNEPNISVPELCNLLIERTLQSSWVIVFKSLISAHHLMCYGNERFIQCMATSSCTFHLNNFIDKTGTQGYEMSTFVRRYAKYLNVKASSYRNMGSDFCKIKRGKEEGVLRNMNTELLLKSLPILQEQLDALIEFDCNPDDLSNGVMNSCFMLLYRDLIQLFAAYNDGIINLFEKYFTMNKKHCKEALDIYKKFIVAMDKVSDFLKVAESVGIDKGNIPDLTKAPGSLLEEMESHLTFLEGKKSHCSATSRSSSVQNAVTALNTTSTAFSSSISSAHELNGLTVDESMRRAVEEEAAVMNQLKSDDFSSWSTPDWNVLEQRMRELATKRTVPGTMSSSSLIKSSISTTSTVPSPLPPPVSSSSFSPTAKLKETVPTTVSPVQNLSVTNILQFKDLQIQSTEDLLMTNPSTAEASFSIPNQSQPFQQVPFSQPSFEGIGTAVPASSFVSEASFNTAFNAPTTTDSAIAFDAFGEVLKPQSTISPTSSPVPEQCESKSSPSGSTKLISSDLDSSLQTLVQNLDINGPKKPPKSSNHQWGSPKPATRTGGANWTPSSPAMTNWGTPQNIQPMAMGVGQFPAAGVVGVPVYGYQQGMPGMVPQQPYRMPPVWPSTPAGFGVTQPGQQQPMGVFVGTSPQHSVIQGTAAGTLPNQHSSNDPFGAL